MIIGVGMDIVEIDRVTESLSRHNQRLRKRLFTDSERAYCEGISDPMPHFAARFAAKEALAKALGCGIADGISWKEIEITRDEKGKPDIVLTGRARDVYTELGGRRLWLTMTHSRQFAAATVVIEGEP